MHGIGLVWLRNDLRVRDNPALDAALSQHDRVIALHVDETDPRLRRRGAASRWWRHESLVALEADLAALGVDLETGGGDAYDAITARQPAVIYWNRRYAPAERDVDAELARRLATEGVMATELPGNALKEPFDIATKTGTPYAVFTPFWNSLRDRSIAAPLAPPRGRESRAIRPVEDGYVAPGWSRKLVPHWQVGERAALQRLSDFLDEIEAYPEGRGYPARQATSMLSPHLAHGEISARQAWHAATALAYREPARAGAVQKFLMELAWRDFNIHQLYHRADIASVPMQPKFERMRWRHSDEDLSAWQRGETGVAIVDAGMHELWETGFMQNRVRMLVGSFLTKNLLLDWRLGERWFWDCLVDADIANNPANWQWIAGCGNDAAPYFRIFNPDTQAAKFDPDGDYVQRWAPTPREPIVHLAASRQRALEAFRALAG